MTVSSLLKDIPAHLCDPISFEPFVNAQTLNCPGAHTYSLDSAIEIFGKMNLTKNVCEKSNECPECRLKVTAYHPNPAFQRLVNDCLGFGNPKATQNDIKPDVIAESKKSNRIAQQRLPPSKKKHYWGGDGRGGR